jgi:hypothetical protein
MFSKLRIKETFHLKMKRHFETIKERNWKERNPHELDAM